VTDPIDFGAARKEAERRREEGKLIWVCNCNCVSFRCYADGAIECASCDTISTSYEGEWRKRLPDTPLEPKEVEPDAVKVIGIDTVDVFLRRLIAAFKAGHDLVAVLAIYQDGRSTTWQQGGLTVKQAGWLKRQIAKAARRLSASAAT
jgi:hypothetical protein